MTIIVQSIHFITPIMKVGNTIPYFTYGANKLQLYGHVSHSSGLAKTITQGTVKGGRRPGRHRKRWEDNIREWTGLEFTKSQRAVEKGEKWRKPVVKSCVVPKRPSRLRTDERMRFHIWYLEGY